MSRFTMQKSWFAVLAAMLVATPTVAQGTFSPEKIQGQISYLASEELRGRGSGDRGNEKAAQFIAKEFAKQGLKPVGSRNQRVVGAADGSGYYQPFSFLAGRALGKKNRFVALAQGREIAYRLSRDFQPSAVSSGGEAEGEIVFAGFGIRAPQVNRDDFAALDVKGRVALVLAGAPTTDPNSVLNSMADIRRKASNAKELGAKAVLVVVPKETEAKDLARFDGGNLFDVGIPVLRVRFDVAGGWFAKGEFEGLAEEAKQGRSVGRILPTRVQIGVEVQRVEKTTANVVGVIEGSDPVLKSEYVVVGAHLDHLGMGGPGSLHRSSEPAIHFGADDNASGTAGILQLAAYFGGSQSGRPRLKRSLILMGFSAEELGLLGSAYYVAHPLIPLENTVAMVNMDMVGRLKNNELVIGGTGTAKEWDGIINGLNQTTKFQVMRNESGFGASDHQSFYLKNLPVLFFFTGLHPEYHTPNDIVEKINAEGEARILELVAGVVREASNAPSRLTFQKLQQVAQSTGSRGFRVYFGSIPNYSANVEGVLLDGVRDGSPAAKGGLKAGDIMVKFGGKSVKNVQDYSDALRDFKPGDKVMVVVKRGAETVELMVILAARSD